MWTLVCELVAELFAKLGVLGRDGVGHYDVVTLLPYGVLVLVSSVGHRLLEGLSLVRRKHVGRLVLLDGGGGLEVLV